MKRFTLALLLVLISLGGVRADELADAFHSPPDAARPWVFWFWMNGNISREGITKDLESMREVGIGGVIWMEVSGPWWAPQGKIEAGSPEWLDAMTWAITEADRLGIDFALSVDFGYGSGGPHIRPDQSMQELVWSETTVDGGEPVMVELFRPKVDYGPALKKVWLRPGNAMNPVVMKALDEIDSYRDVAVFALPTAKAAAWTDDLHAYDGRGWTTDLEPLADVADTKPIAHDEVFDLTDRMDGDGTLRWVAPRGKWTVVRLGYASNFKMTRPSPQAAVGLECDRLHPRGIDAHFDAHLRPILEAAGPAVGRSLKYIHIDSWEAHGQNWTIDFAQEFRRRRGYDLEPWLPALIGSIVESAEQTERFLWDMRQTVNEMTLERYVDRLRERIEPYGVQFSCEPYGRLCIDSLTYGGRADFPIAEFWTEREIEGLFPTFQDYWYMSMKGLASVANTYGKSRVGAEAFTGSRGWVDHPYLLKSMGDEAFAAGISQYVIHLSAHQPYDSMKPGLTHRRWGQHFNRHQTWWPMSGPYLRYVARCQTLLQRGTRVTDVACLYHEGAPLNFNDIVFELPPGHDYDLCSPEIIQQMQVRDGVIHLPSGASYRYLALPQSGRITRATAKKVAELRAAGATVVQQTPIQGTPGLEDYPRADRQVRRLAADWAVLPADGWTSLFAADGVAPDFAGDDLRWLHRRVGSTDLYFVASGSTEPIARTCTFRVAGKTAELWNPETGEIFALPEVREAKGRTTIPLRFEPLQSWFVVFRDEPSAGRSQRGPWPDWQPVEAVAGPWTVRFDPAWGTDKPVVMDKLISWSEHPEPLVKYYSGMATYRTTFRLPESFASGESTRLCLDLGQVEVMARVTLNGQPCGITWKPPYRVELGDAWRPGRNELEVEVVNTWVNRMIGDEQLPLDSEWKDWETLISWPDWFLERKTSPAGRKTFTTARHYQKDSPPMPAGLLGPVRLMVAGDGS